MSRSAVPALVVLMLALFPAVAQAAPWVIRGYEPDAPVVGDVVTFHATRDKGSNDARSLVWDFGDGGGVVTGTATPTHQYTAAGTYTVTLSIAGETAPQAQISIVVAEPPPPPPPPNGLPSAAFTFSPTNPLVGDGVLFTGGSDPDGDPITRLWDFGDGTTSSDETPIHTYATDRSYIVTLTVSDNRGGSSDPTFKTVTVSPRPGSPPDGGSTPSSPGTPIPPPSSPGTPKSPVPMRPFPIVRIAGVILPHGARLRILSVRAPRGARVSVRCTGRSCPAASLARTSATGLVRLHRFERRLGAGVRLELFVRKPKLIGKYTRFVIRAGKAPARVDRCLMPGGKRPVRCP